jgi:hypothetical protein
MDVNLRNKLIEIGVDKLLIGLLIGLAGYVTNSSLERYKLVEAQRVTGTAEFVKACSELWILAYEFEDQATSMEGKRTEIWRLLKFGKRAEADALAAQVSAQEEIKTAQFVKYFKAVRERQFVVGEPMADRFIRYAGLVNFREDLREQARTGPVEGREGANKLAEDMDKLISAMRFTATAAREHAISKLPP